MSSFLLPGILRKYLFLSYYTSFSVPAQRAAVHKLPIRLLCSALTACCLKKIPQCYNKSKKHPLYFAPFSFSCQPAHHPHSVLMINIYNSLTALHISCGARSQPAPGRYSSVFLFTPNISSYPSFTVSMEKAAVLLPLPPPTIPTRLP